jgi:hypothetical protein
MAEALLRQFVGRVFGDYVTEKSLQKAIPSGGFATAIFQGLLPLGQWSAPFTPLAAGSLQFRDDLELKPHILERLGVDVPFTITRGVLSSVYVSIPYGNMATRTSTVSIGGLSLLMRSKSPHDAEHSSLLAALRAQKAGRVTKAVDDRRPLLPPRGPPPEASSKPRPWHPRAAPEEESPRLPQAPPGFFERFMTRLMDNLMVRHSGSRSVLHNDLCYRRSVWLVFTSGTKTGIPWRVCLSLPA